MKWTHFPLGAAAAIIVTVAGGNAPAQPAGKAGPTIFRDTTGASLPEGAECTDLKTITVAFVGDTHYVKIKAGATFSKFLAGNFEPDSWEGAQQSLIPPDSWKEDLKFWQENDIKNGKIYYTKKYTAAGGTTICSVIALNESARTAFFVAAECRD
jgi:hypothetical protein